MPTDPAGLELAGSTCHNRGMTTPQHPQPGAQPPAPQHPTPPLPYAAPPAQKPESTRNTLGLIALIAAGIGFIFACIPGALIVGWILLPVAFILGIVSLFMKGKGKGLGIAALIISVVGTIVGFVVFFTIVATAAQDAFDSAGETTVVTPSEEASAAPSGDTDASTEPTEEEAPAAEEGTRENPLPIGTMIANDEWEVTVNSVTLDAGAAIAAENQFNEAAPDGFTYGLVNITATYVGTDEAGGTPAFILTEYVTADGATTDLPMVVGPEPLATAGTLYNGGSVTGNTVILVPAEGAAEGALAVAAGILSDKVFYAVQ